MSQNSGIERLYDNFYRCLFSEVLGAIAAIQKEELSSEVSLIKASTLFELHRVDEAKKVLESMRQTDGEFDENYLHASARLNYMAGDSEKACEIWNEIHAGTEHERHKFKSLLGIANCYYSEERFNLIPPLISRLISFEPLTRDDDRISLMIFLGNYYLFSGGGSSIAKSYFTKALNESAHRTWNYFIGRSLYGLAHVAKDENQQTEMLCTLNLLKAFIDESESVCFVHFVNNEFKDYFSIDTPLEFDSENKRIMVNSHWKFFHESPMLYKFLEMLHVCGDFVTKSEIAAELWDEEDYKPMTHDPRIFDIAKRARSMIEAYDNQPVVLLSGRSGYKLASA